MKYLLRLRIAYTQFWSIMVLRVLWLSISPYHYYHIFDVSFWLRCILFILFRLLFSCNTLLIFEPCNLVLWEDEDVKKSRVNMGIIRFASTIERLFPHVFRMAHRQSYDQVCFDFNAMIHDAAHLVVNCLNEA